jgi:hypothetical protein
MWTWIGKILGSGGDAKAEPKVETKAEPKRAREKGRYKADDKSTADVNEAWVGGEAPKKKKRKFKLRKEFR